MQNSALLLLNLGSPDSTSVSDVRRYLGEFLMDERVIDAPWLIRSMIVKGFILPFRPKKSAHAYSKVWTDRGSPLKVITNDFKKEVEKIIDMPIGVAMRYGNPNPFDAITQIKREKPDITRLYIAPMYPHFAMSSYETAVEHVLTTIRKLFTGLEIKILKPFYSEKDYIESLSEIIRPFVNTPHDHILFSYHGLPVRHLKKSDTTQSHCYSNQSCCDRPSVAWHTCYKHQVTQTTRLVAEKLGIKKERYTVSFQSRLGRDEWIKPFTVELLTSFPEKGIRDLIIVCPAFVADCLETLEEIAMAGKETFINAGGKSFTVVPCLNTSPMWVQTFSGWVNHRETEHASLWK